MSRGLKFVVSASTSLGARRRSLTLRPLFRSAVLAMIAEALRREEAARLTVSAMSAR